MWLWLWVLWVLVVGWAVGLWLWQVGLRESRLLLWNGREVLVVDGRWSRRGLGGWGRSKWEGLEGWAWAWVGVL